MLIVQVRVQLKSPTFANASVVNTAITIGRAESTSCNQTSIHYIPVGSWTMEKE